MRSDVNKQGKLFVFISFQCVDVCSEVGKILEGKERIYIKIDKPSYHREMTIHV